MGPMNSFLLVSSSVRLFNSKETTHFDSYLRIDKACITFLKLFTNFPTRKLQQDR